MSEHTRGPWVVECGNDERPRRIVDEYGEHISYIASTRYLDGRRDPEAVANAVRIVACVNACEGMDDPEAEIARLKAERDEALGLLADLYNDRDDSPEMRRVEEILRRDGRLT